MKANTPELLKFKRLQRKLGINVVTTVGLLELLWINTAKNAPEGDIGRFSNEEIAISCYWDGDPDELVSSLVACGWLDTCDTWRLIVHDWAEHAPRWVHGNMKRHGRSFRSGRSQPTEQPTEQPTREATIATSLGTSSKPSQAKPSQAKEEKSPEQEAPPLSEHMKSREFKSVWSQWKQKLEINNGRPLDEITEQQQLFSLSGCSTSEAIAVVRYSASRTKCNNLIFNFDRTALAPPPKPARQPERVFEPTSPGAIAVVARQRAEAAALAEEAKNAG